MYWEEKVGVGGALAMNVGKGKDGKKRVREGHEEKGGIQEK